MTRMTLYYIISSSRCALCPCTIHWNLTSHHLPSQTQGDAWFKPSSENVHAGVCLRINPGQFRVFPYENRYLEPFEAAVRVLNPMVAVKIRSAAVHVALGSASVSFVGFERSPIYETIIEATMPQLSMWTATPAYRSWTQCSICLVLTRSNAEPSLSVTF